MSVAAPQAASRLITLRVDPAQADDLSALLADAGLRHGYVGRAVDLGNDDSDRQGRALGGPITTRFEVVLSADEVERVAVLLGRRLPQVRLDALPAVLAGDIGRE